MSAAPVGRGLVFRFVAGRRLVGKHPSASTFWHRDDTATRKYWRHSGIRRLAYRLLLWVAFGGGFAAFRTDPQGTVAALVVTTAVVVVVGGAGLGWGMWTYRHRNYEVGPLYAKLAQQLKELPPTPRRGAFTVTRDLATIRLRLPAESNPDWLRRRKVLRAVEEHTGADYDTSWNLQDRPPTVIWTRRPAPPGLVQWDQIQDQLQQLDGSHLILGLDGYSRPVTLDLEAEAAHLLLSIGTGGGKSTFLLQLICQLLRKQGPDHVERIVILDPKYLSLDAVDGVERVQIYREPDEMATAMQSLQETINGRKRRQTGGRVVLVVEEGNSFTDMMQMWWSEQRRGRDPKRCPALGTLSNLLLQGREFHMNVVMVAQHASVAAIGGGGGATGGTAARSSFGKVVLSRFDPKIWKSFTGRPESSSPELGRDPIGQAIVWADGNADRMQLVHIDRDQARADALSSSGAATVPLEPYQEPVYSLREASADVQSVVPLSYSALRKRKQHSGTAWVGVKQGTITRYTRQQLMQYLRLEDSDGQGEEDPRGLRGASEDPAAADRGGEEGAG